MNLHRYLRAFVPAGEELITRRTRHGVVPCCRSVSQSRRVRRLLQSSGGFGGLYSTHCAFSRVRSGVQPFSASWGAGG